MNLECPIVFVIDDDASVRRAVCRLLRSEGFRVETFASGSDFLRALDCTRRGCVVLDVRMPGLSGFEVLECLNAHGRTLPVILITGHGDVPMAMRARKVGCVSFLAKPFEDEALLGAVRDALRDQDEAGTS
jgi:two-component system, LuxR family, response regulator FixJ